jgi:hypothetical protein
MKITTFMVQTVRKHVLLSFAGGPVEKFKHTRNKFHKDEAQFFMKYRVSETVISLNKASLKNSLSGKMLTRNQCRADEFRRYNTLRKGGIKETSLYKYLGGKTFCDRKIEEAGCDMCIDFGVRKFEALALFAKDSVFPLFDNWKELQGRWLALFKKTRLHVESGSFLMHCRDCSAVTEGSVSCWHCRQHVLSGDTKNLQEECKHEHDMSCATCNLVLYLKAQLLLHIQCAHELDLVDDAKHAKLRAKTDNFFGEKGLYRYYNHLLHVAPTLQHKRRVVEAMDHTTALIHFDYWSKLEWMKLLMGKKASFGRKKTSAFGAHVILRVPPAGAKDVKGVHWPEGAEPGELVHIHYVILCDDSKQDGFHAFNALSGLLKILHQEFPYLKDAELLGDMGPHFFCTHFVTNMRRMSKDTGIKVKGLKFEGEGHGTCDVDSFCSKGKRRMRQNVKVGVCVSVV